MRKKNRNQLFHMNCYDNTKYTHEDDVMSTQDLELSVVMVMSEKYVCLGVA